MHVFVYYDCIERERERESSEFEWVGPQYIAHISRNRFTSCFEIEYNTLKQSQGRMLQYRDLSLAACFCLLMVSCHRTEWIEM